MDQTVSYLYETVPLSAGHHTFKWVYYKNPEVGLGADIARISVTFLFSTMSLPFLSLSDFGRYWPISSLKLWEFKLLTTLHAPLVYLECSSQVILPLFLFSFPHRANSPLFLFFRATYTAQEQRNCLYCPENTYTPDFRSTDCTPCPAGYYSYNGADTCTAYERPCSAEDDSIYLFTECEFNEFSNSWTRTKYYLWNVPLFCDNSNASLPANQTNLPCSSHFSLLPLPFIPSL